MAETIFSKIIKGEIKTDFLYEDEICIVINDKYPKANTHLLIIPKKEIVSIMDMEEGDEQIVGHLFNVAKKVAKEKNLKGYKLQINVGKEGGQEIFHLHIHLTSKFS